MALMTQHNLKHVASSRRFASMLPGMSDLDDLDRGKLRVTFWKWLVFAMVWSPSTDITDKQTE